MSDAEWAVDAVAVFEGRVERAIVLIMAWVAHVVGTEAAVEGSGAAILAFPVNLRGTVLLAARSASTDVFEQAALAEKVFLLGLASFLVSHLTLTVDESTEVRLLAVIAQVEGASVVGKLLWLSIVCIIFVLESLICKDTLFLSIDQCLFLHKFA